MTVFRQENLEEHYETGEDLGRWVRAGTGGTRWERPRVALRTPPGLPKAGEGGSVRSCGALAVLMRVRWDLGLGAVPGWCLLGLVVALAAVGCAGGRPGGWKGGGLAGEKVTLRRWRRTPPSVFRSPVTRLKNRGELCGGVEPMVPRWRWLSRRRGGTGGAWQSAAGEALPS